MNPRVLKVEQSATLRIADMAREIERGGEKVVKFQTGDPDFDTPEAIILEAYEAMKSGYTHYADTRGLLEFREAIANKLHNDNGLDYDPVNEILVTNGASHAIFITLQTLLEPGDQVLIPGPFWMTYASSTVLAGGIPIEVPSLVGENFALDVENLKALVTNKTKIIVLNSPNNPTGYVMGPKDLAAVAEIAEMHNLYVIADEVYEKIIYEDAEHISFATLEGMKARTITVNSFSKTYAMTGWRVGYMAAEADLISEMLKVSQCSGTNVPPYSQRAARLALTEPVLQTFVEEMRRTYERRRNLVIQAASEIEGLELARPKGAFYFMLNVSRFNGDSSDFALKLLQQARVSLVPGISFGQCAEGWVRITFATDESQLTKGLDRIGEFIRTTYRA